MKENSLLIFAAGIKQTILIYWICEKRSAKTDFRSSFFSRNQAEENAVLSKAFIVCFWAGNKRSFERASSDRPADATC